MFSHFHHSYVKLPDAALQDFQGAEASLQGDHFWWQWKKGAPGTGYQLLGHKVWPQSVEFVVNGIVAIIVIIVFLIYQY